MKLSVKRAMRATLVLALVTPPLGIAFLLFFTPTPKASATKATHEMYTIAMAIEAYYIAHGCYPAPMMEKNRSATGATTPTLTFVDIRTLGLQPTYRWPCVAGGDSVYRGPYDYRDWYTANRFFASPSPYRYARVGGCYMIISAGPDGDYDVDPYRDYDPVNYSQPSPHLQAEAGTYDITNGTESSGDLYRVKM